MRDVRIALITSICTLGVLALISSTSLYGASQTTSLLEVTFIDVGQGDATLIESPTGVQVLIDGGRDASVLAGLQEALGFFDRTLDMVVATHPDADHIGGLIDVLERYEVARILMTENVNDTPMYARFMERVSEEGAEVYYARRGQEFVLGAGEGGTTTLSVLFPVGDVSEMESNASSIVSQLRYGDAEYIFMGDAPKEIEEYLVDAYGRGLQSEVLKVGHHGSKTSTAETFVATVAPLYAIISAGHDNTYGHPHQVVLDVLSQYGVTYKNTASEGSVKSFSDGTRVWFE
jgi:competence protein ComEC